MTKLNVGTTRSSPVLSLSLLVYAPWKARFSVAHGGSIVPTLVPCCCRMANVRPLDAPVGVDILRKFVLIGLLSSVESGLIGITALSTTPIGVDVAEEQAQADSGRSLKHCPGRQCAPAVTVMVDRYSWALQVTQVETHTKLVRVAWLSITTALHCAAGRARHYRPRRVC